MPRPLPALLVVAAIAVLSTGCSALGLQPSPTTTFVDPTGEAVTVDWRDYPAHAGIDGELLLDHPDQAGLAGPATALMQRLDEAVQTASGLQLEPAQPRSAWFEDGNWHVTTGNGYGGESMLVTVNCCLHASDRAPDAGQWRAVLDAASAVTVEAGLGPLRLEHESAPMTEDPAWLEEFRDRYCNAPDEACWLWSAQAFDGVQWVTLTIQDGVLDPSGDAVRDAAAIGRPAGFITIDYGATVVRTGAKDACADALAPFAGLERPDSTSSE